MDNTIDALLGQRAAAELVDAARALFAGLGALDEDTRLDAINEIRAALHRYSPLREHPVDCVQWVRAEDVQGNSYNPNVVAPPEMRLLSLSIRSDGYTQPIVVWQEDPRQATYEIVDGFHRQRVGKEDKAVRAAVLGRLPVTVVNWDRTGQEDRRAATIRHNRARGQHTVDGMSEIVLDLARRGKSDEWIGAELGLDPDEVRRLRQVGGLAEMYADDELSEAWEADTDTAWGAGPVGAE